MIPAQAPCVHTQTGQEANPACSQPIIAIAEHILPALKSTENSFFFILLNPKLFCRVTVPLTGPGCPFPRLIMSIFFPRSISKRLNFPGIRKDTEQEQLLPKQLELLTHSLWGTRGNSGSFRAAFINLRHGNKLKLQLPASQKWRSCRDRKDTEKHLLC